MSSNSSRPAVEGRGISRRTLVKGAAHAAWVVPAVQVVSVVPAFAASNACELSVTDLTATYANGVITVRLKAFNTGGIAAKGVQLLFSFEERFVIAGSTSAPSAWPYGTHNSSSISYTHSGSLAAGGSASSSSLLEFKVSASISTTAPGSVNSKRNLTVTATGQQDKTGSTTACSTGTMSVKVG